MSVSKPRLESLSLYSEYISIIHLNFSSIVHPTSLTAQTVYYNIREDRKMNNTKNEPHLYTDRNPSSNNKFKENDITKSKNTELN